MLERFAKFFDCHWLVCSLKKPFNFRDCSLKELSGLCIFCPNFFMEFIFPFHHKSPGKQFIEGKMQISGFCRAFVCFLYVPQGFCNEMMFSHCPGMFMQNVFQMIKNT